MWQRASELQSSLLGGGPVPHSTLPAQQDEVLEALVWHHAVQHPGDEDVQALVHPIRPPLEPSGHT